MTISLNTISIKYRVGEGGLGGYSTGDIIDAYLIESTNDSEFRFVYHPENNETCPCIDVCLYNIEERLYEPIDSNIYINLIY